MQLDRRAVVRDDTVLLHGRQEDRQGSLVGAANHGGRRHTIMGTPIQEGLKQPQGLSSREFVPAFHFLLRRLVVVSGMAVTCPSARAPWR